LKKEQKFKVAKKFKSSYFDLQSSFQGHDVITFASRTIGLYSRYYVVPFVHR